MVQMSMARRDAVEHAIPYFRELVESALARQRLTATEDAAFYIVHLLANFLQPASEEQPGPLAIRLAEALDAGGQRQWAGLKAVGDESLFVSGFFADSLRRSLVDVDYYIAIGGTAYDALGRRETDVRSPIFAELARKFVQFVEVLNEVSDRTSCASNADVIRVYERWLKTGGARAGKLLVEKGIIPGPRSGGTVQ